MLIKQIRADLLAARKSGDLAGRSILTTLLSECEAVGKKSLTETTDAQVVAMVKKFIKNAEETLKLCSGSTAVEHELAIYEKYLPQQLTEDEIYNIAVEVAKIGKFHNCNMGTIMSFLKDNYNGQYDGKLASSVVRRVLETNIGE